MRFAVHTAFIRLGTFYTLASTVAACSGGSGSTPTSPTSSGTPSSVAVSVTAVTATTERTSTGVTYRTAFTLNETRGQVGLTISSIRVNLASPNRTSGTTFDSSDNISTRLIAGGSLTYRLAVTSTNTTDLHNQVSFVIAYVDDRGVAGTFTSSTSAISPPTSTPPSPAPPTSSANCQQGPIPTPNTRPDLPACATVSSLAITCRETKNQVGFPTLTCTGVVMADIRTPITSGQIQVRADTYPGTLTQTITIIPNTSPGVMTIQLLEKSFEGSGKESCRDNQIVAIGDRVGTTGGRSLFQGVVPTRWSCS